MSNTDLQRFQFDIETDKFVGVGESARFFPEAGDKPSRATLFRWAQKGINGNRLPAIKVGRRVLTTKAAVRHFLEASTQGVECVQ